MHNNPSGFRISTAKSFIRRSGITTALITVATASVFAETPAAVPGTGAGSTIGGGSFNSAGGDYSTVGGGYGNSSVGRVSTIAGGEGNQTPGNYGVIGGGYYNKAGYLSFVGGGIRNQAYNYSAIAGGWQNYANGLSSFIGGGALNVASGERAVIGGGLENDSTAQYSAVLGGYLNGATGSASSVGGGRDNLASREYSTVGGGISNQAHGNSAVVAGGKVNTADGWWSTVSGGFGNLTNGDLSVVGGGEYNLAYGNYSAIPGGRDNYAGELGFAAGRRAKATHSGAFVWADNNGFDFGSTADNQFSARCTGGAQFVSAINASGVATAGVSLAAGGGSWSALSDRNAKTNVTAVNARAVLAALAAIPIQKWSYKSQDAAIRHIGPMAQDFAKAFEVGEDNRHISTIDADGVALAAIKGLHEELLIRDETLREQALLNKTQSEQLLEQKEVIERQQEMIKTQETVLADMTARIDRIESASGLKPADHAEAQ